MTPAIFGLSGPQLTDAERAFFRQADPVGYILFARNCLDAGQVRRLTDDLRSIHGRDSLLIAIDQEGGRVQRMKPPGWNRYPAGEAFDRLYQVAPASAIEAIRLNAEAMGRELAAAGVTLDFHAPLDLRRADTDAVIGDRALGSEPMQVAALGRALIDGLARSGIVGCLKHAPGHGRARADSHKELPVVTASDTELATDLLPFQRLASVPVAMTAHIVFTAWDDRRPATLSPVVVQTIIRDRIGFDGLLLTDDVDMQALSGSIADRAERALLAGCDVVLNCWAKMEDMAAIADHCPALTPEAHARLERAVVHEASEPFDGSIADVLERRDSLFTAAGLTAMG